MLEPKEIEIDGIKFILHPLKGFKAVKLDKKVISLLLPVLGGIGGLDTEINLGSALNGFSTALDNMAESEYEKFITDLLSTVQIFPIGAAPEEITSSTIDKYFQGASVTLYKLMFEVMRYNKFTPFVLISEAGVEIGSILSFGALTKNPKTPKKELKQSEK